MNGGNTHHYPSVERHNSSISESRDVGYQRARSYMSSPSSEKENSGGGLDATAPLTKKQRPMTMMSTDSSSSMPPPAMRHESGSRIKDSDGSSNGEPVENWKRAAEVTSQLKARIEQMKVCPDTLILNGRCC